MGALARAGHPLTHPRLNYTMLMNHVEPAVIGRSFAVLMVVVGRSPPAASSWWCQR